MVSVPDHRLEQPVATMDESERRSPRRSMRAPALFIGFPSPMLVKDDEYVKALRRCGIQLRPPRGIVVASARFHTVRPLRVTGSQKPRQLHDYGDYPAWLNTMSYPCPGAPALASKVATLLQDAGTPAVIDMGQGLDFTTWMPLSLLYASPKVPIVEVSLPAGGSPEDMMGVGRALAPLRAAGYMIVGAGAVVCNPHRVRHDNHNATPEGWARAFDDWVNERLQALDIDALLQYRRQGPHAHISAPTPEYLDPLFFVLGANLQGDRVMTLFEGFHSGALSMRTCLLVGRRKDDLRLPDELIKDGAA
jgi:4,5-DOPA dioxygenase extradiol